MASKKSGYVATLDGLNFWAKLILCLPVLDIVWAIYRIVKGVKTNNVLMLVVGVLWIVPGVAIGWLIDIISTLIFGRPKLLA